ncbi:hypothetical protein AMECASPLE_031028, partial [Ameca splendens]
LGLGLPPLLDHLSASNQMCGLLLPHHTSCWWLVPLPRWCVAGSRWPGLGACTLPVAGWRGLGPPALRICSGITSWAGGLVAAAPCGFCIVAARWFSQDSKPENEPSARQSGEK